MVALDFLRKGKRDVTVMHFDHGTSHSVDARKFIESYCDSHDLKLMIGECTVQKSPRTSDEMFWRDQRHKFFCQAGSPVITAHHLDDVTEWWILSALRGMPSVIPIENEDNNVCRPFLVTPKESIQYWAQANQVPHICDPSNESRAHMRNIVRHDIMQHALKVNPGLRKMVRKKVIQSIEK
jgi:tRNA(Ile)-lysidine synthase